MPSLKKSKVKSLRRGLPAGLTIAVLALMLLLGPAGAADASTVSIKLTTNALGLGTSEINNGRDPVPVTEDKVGFYTSDTIGEGSVLQIQLNEKAGPGIISPLLVTVTAREHLDITSSFFTSPNDYHAGIIYISSDGNAADEGLGVRAFRVDGTTGERVFDTPKSQGGTGRALIEGSKHVSGGTDNKTEHVTGTEPNRPPHVDENVTFNFDPAFNVLASSVEVLLSKFESTDIIDLYIDLVFGTDINLSFLGTGAGSDTFEELEDKLWKLKFNGLAGLSGDLVNSFTIRANDDDPENPTGTAEHFFISGLTVEASPVPIPGAIWLLGSGLIGLAGIRRKFRK